MPFSRADFFNLFPGSFTSYVVYSGHRTVQGRQQPSETSSKNGLFHSNCENPVRTGFPINDFVQINDNGKVSWLRERYVPLGARIHPQEKVRMHIKVRRFPNPERGHWLEINGSPCEIARNQLVALLDYDSTNHMVYVGFVLPDGTPMQGWVRSVNLCPIN